MEGKAEHALLAAQDPLTRQIKKRRRGCRAWLEDLDQSSLLNDEEPIAAIASVCYQNWLREPAEKWLQLYLGRRLSDRRRRQRNSEERQQYCQQDACCHFTALSKEFHVRRRYGV